MLQLVCDQGLEIKESLTNKKGDFLVLKSSKMKDAQVARQFADLSPLKKHVGSCLGLSACTQHRSFSASDVKCLLGLY